MAEVLTRGLSAALNHLLAGEGWARERLWMFAGQHVRLQGGPLRLDLTVDGDGFFRSWESSGDEPPAVTVELPPDAPFRLLVDRQSVFGAARLSGKADFTETLAFVFRNLRWDVEEDLAKVFGDVVARRLVRGGKVALEWQKQAGTRLAANVAEYVSQESNMGVPRQEMEGIRAQIEALVESLERLEKRVARLSSV